MTAVSDICFDGLVGSTHHYAGLAQGNVASLDNVGRIANPRAAALQGLAKMKFVADQGIGQGVFPPHERPRIDMLRALGFSGTDGQVLERAARQSRSLLASVTSASSMWAANAATVSPSSDTADGRVHMTPANLTSTLHRSLEAEQTVRTLRRIFPDERCFVHHPALPAALADEGAANHTRLVDRDGQGKHLFVYGRTLGRDAASRPKVFPARQHREASESIARRHGLAPEHCLFLQQAPEAIDAGVFHADVILVGQGRLLLYHEEAFADGAAALEGIAAVLGTDVNLGRVRREELSIDDAVQSYLFNSQLLQANGGSLLLIVPSEAWVHPRARAVIERWIGDTHNPIRACAPLDLRQSMQNGGGPACLRLRVPLTAEERAAIHAPCMLDEVLYERLVKWVERHYRDRLRLEDLSDPQLLDEGRRALDELTGILKLGSDFYAFQRM